MFDEYSNADLKVLKCIYGKGLAVMYSSHIADINNSLDLPSTYNDTFVEMTSRYPEYISSHLGMLPCLFVDCLNDYFLGTTKHFQLVDTDSVRRTVAHFVTDANITNENPICLWPIVKCVFIKYGLFLSLPPFVLSHNNIEVLL